MRDALSEVLGPVRLRQTCWAFSVGRAPWGLAFPGGQSCLRFHYVLRGHAWLDVEDADSPRVALAPGELVVLPLGHTHFVRDQPHSPLTPIQNVARCDARRAVSRLEVGTAGPETTFVTGAFVLDDPLAQHILAVLPPVIRMTPENEHAGSVLENIQLIAREVETESPGSELVLLRLADVLLIQILRSHLAALPDAGGGFLRALREPHVASAIGAMHRRPDAPWTVATLGAEVGLSRSVFAARFMQTVGETPLAYLTRLRMQKAGALLREGATLAQASQRTGYASEASFSHAFRQWSGVAPGAWRRAVGA